MERGTAAFGEGGLDVFLLLQAADTRALTEQNAQLGQRGVVIDTETLRVVPAATFQHRGRDRRDFARGRVGDFRYGQVIVLLARDVVHYGLGTGRSHPRPPLYGVLERVQPSSERVDPVDIVAGSATQAVRVLEDAVDNRRPPWSGVRQFHPADVHFLTRRSAQQRGMARGGVDGVVGRGTAAEVDRA